MNLLGNDYNNYTGILGAQYSKEGTKFILWAPNANNVRLACLEKTVRSIPIVPKKY
nr:hypothetical protein [Clostridium butyricum]